MCRSPTTSRDQGNDGPNHLRSIGHFSTVTGCPRARLPIATSDLHLVPVDPRVADCLMPSKFYGVLASGTPLVAVAPEDCELSQLTRTHRLGAVAAPGQPRALAGAILALADRPGELPAMDARARRLAERSFDRRQVTARFADLLHNLPNTERQQPPSCRKSQSTAKN